MQALVKTMSDKRSPATVELVNRYAVAVFRAAVAGKVLRRTVTVDCQLILPKGQGQALGPTKTDTSYRKVPPALGRRGRLSVPREGVSRRTPRPDLHQRQGPAHQAHEVL